MNYALLFLLAVITSPADAECKDDSQPLSILPRNKPILAESGRKLEDFIPPGWKLVESKPDDFNHDKLTDLALTITENNPKNILKNDCGLGEETVDTNPYALLVALKQKDTSYKLAASDFDIIPRLEDPVSDQPYSGISTENGILSLGYHFWQSAGSWSTSDQTYKFRFQNNCMRLIGHEYHWLHRATGEESGTSTNFISGAYIIYKQNQDNKRLSKHKKKLKKNKVICLGNVPKEFDHINY